MLARSRTLSPVVAVLLALSVSCLHQEGPEDPTPIEVPAVVSVRVEYRQPNGCLNSVSDCGGPVYFFASWMNPQGTYVALSRVEGTFIWKGTIANVPVNFPPRDHPYLVRVYDPFLRDYQTAGVTADRLQVGGQVLTKFLDYGTPAENGLIYIDAQGVGHSPF